MTSEVPNIDGNLAPQIIIDWLQFTLVDQSKTQIYDSTNTIIQILGLKVNDFTILSKGMMGYKSQMYLNDIRVLYDGQANMGTHVIISGKGCRYYETTGSLIDLIKRIDDAGGHLTRIDIAMDDKTGKIIPFGRLKNDIIKGNVVTKWKESLELIKRKNKTGEIVGHTIDLGSRSSRIYFRLYNKAMEQGLDSVWNRLELEIKKEYAEKVQKILSEKNVGQLMKEILNNYIRIVQPNKNDTNKSRWETKKYWTELIDTAEKQPLTVQAEERDIDDTKEWIIRQVAPSLALIVLNDEGKVQFIQDQIQAGYTRLSEKHMKKLKR